MSIEVYPVKGARYDGFRENYRSIKEVAEEVKERYEKVIAQGGSIIGSHNVNVEHVPSRSSMTSTDRSFTGAQYLLLVAEFPPAHDMQAEVEE